MTLGFWKISKKNFDETQVCSLTKSNDYNLRKTYTYKENLRTCYQDIDENNVKFNGMSFKELTNEKNGENWEILENILKEKLLIFPKEKQPIYLEKLSEILYREGILFDTLRALKDPFNCDERYFIKDDEDASIEVDISITAEGIFLDQKVTINKVSCLTRVFESQEITVDTTIHLQLNKQNELEYKYVKVAVMNTPEGIENDFSNNFQHEENIINVGFHNEPANPILNWIYQIFANVLGTMKPIIINEPINTTQSEYRA